MTQKPFKEKFKDNYNGIPVEYALQVFDTKERDRPWGTADALVSIKSIIKCPFVICNGDDIYGENTFRSLYTHLKKGSEEATIGYKLSEVIPEVGKTNRGIFQSDNDYVKDLKEVFNIEKNNLSATNTRPDDLCSMNIFALHPNTVDLILIILDDFKKKHQGNRRIEALLPEMIPILIKQGKIKMKIYLTNDRWIGVTNPQDEAVVREMLKE